MYPPFWSPFFVTLAIVASSTYDTMPNEIPFAMLYVNGISASVRNEGMAYTISEKSICFTDPIISTPTMTSAAAVAEPGTSATSGDRNSASRKQIPVVTDVRPVRPPCATPAELST
ncbi:hypothetical protein D3C84_995670 [compost metagenome]